MVFTGQKNINKNKKPARWFFGGFLGVLLLSLVFYSGYQLGKGAWQINFIVGKSAVSSNKNLPDKLDYSSVNEVYQSLKRNYDGQLDVNKLMVGLKKGLVEAAGDPYTTYLDTEEAKSFTEQLNGSFTGIGAELSKQKDDIVVIAPITGFPAEKAGLKPKDVIIEIDGQDASGLSVDEAVKRIRGEKGTNVKLTVIRGEQQKLDFNITRDTITIPSVNSKIVDGNIGYIQVTRFSEDTAGLVDKAAQDFKNKNVKGVVVDLRNDPGGYLNASVKVANQWLKDGQIILQEKRGGKVIKTYVAEGTGQLQDTKTVVLINEGSASASEILAGALKDNNAATIIGVNSFGKGSVQEFSNFTSGDVLKVTVARWFTPGGKNIDKEGIAPNQKVELSEADVKAGKDTQLEAAKAYIIKR
jgi:carboxyl-terminal processing protease